MRAQTEGVGMTREEIYRLINEAKAALKPTHDDAATIKTKVTIDAHHQYLKIAKRIFGENANGHVIFPQQALAVCEKIRKSKSKATLRIYARAVRHVSLSLLDGLIKVADTAQRAGNWPNVEFIVSQPQFTALTTLAKLMPSDYSNDWQPQKKRKSKKTSLSKLPKDWRELMAANSSGQYRVPMIIALLTGVRPEELEKGVMVKLLDNSLYVHIKGAKVKENAGQPYRQFKLANHSLTDELIGLMNSENQTDILVKVDNGNSVTTHMRAVGKKIWPKRKESITCYTARHAMAAECKQAIFEGADTDLASQVLGHVVDKTASYYGNRFQSGGVSVVPPEIRVPKEIKHKSAARNSNRKESIPSKKNVAIKASSNKNRP